MDCGVSARCSESKNPTTTTSTMATTLASNYWTATAYHVMQVPPSSQEEEEGRRWNQHKFGLCPVCKIGLDDRADFTFNYQKGGENGIMMCWDCDGKLKPKRKCMRCNSEVKGEEGIVLSSWDFRTRALVVLQCSRCT